MSHIFSLDLEKTLLIQKFFHKSMNLTLSQVLSIK